MNLIIPAIPTGMSQVELYKLAELAQDKTVCEAGAWYGSSSVVLSQTAKLVVSCDWHYGEHGNEDTLQLYLSNVRMRDVIIPVIGRLECILPLLKNDSFDMMFIDAAHDYKSVKHDTEHANRLATKIICWHDYHRDGEQAAVTQVVDEFCNENGYELNLVDTLAWIEK